MSIDPVELRPEQSFQAERWVRFIRECQDIEQLRDMAMALVQQLTQQKAANAWMASRASESENEKLEVVAEMIRQTSNGVKDASDRRI